MRIPGYTMKATESSQEANQMSKIDVIIIADSSHHLSVFNYNRRVAYSTVLLKIKLTSPTPAELGLFLSATPKLLKVIFLKIMYVGMNFFSKKRRRNIYCL